MLYTCPVCGYPNLPVRAADYEICPSCGTEFEYHDARRTHDQLRAEWISSGMAWHSRVIPQPVNWSAMNQLIEAGYVRKEER